MRPGTALSVSTQGEESRDEVLDSLQSLRGCSLTINPHASQLKCPELNLPHCEKLLQGKKSKILLKDFVKKLRGAEPTHRRTQHTEESIPSVNSGPVLLQTITQVLLSDLGVWDVMVPAWDMELRNLSLEKNLTGDGTGVCGDQGTCVSTNAAGM